MGKQMRLKIELNCETCDGTGKDGVEPIAHGNLVLHCSECDGTGYVQRYIYFKLEE